MKHSKNLHQYPAKNCSCLLFLRPILPVKYRFYKFQIPVAESTPYKMIHSVCSLIKSIRFNPFRYRTDCFYRSADNPPINSQFAPFRNEIFSKITFIHFTKPWSVPQLRDKISIAGYTLLRQFNVTSLCCHRGERKTQSISAILIHQNNWIDDISLGLGHFLSFFVPD